MSEQLERTESTYLQVLIKALSDSESGLSEAGVLELRRRLDTVNAIIHSIRPIFYEVLPLEKQLGAIKWTSLRAASIWRRRDTISGGTR